MAWEHEALSGLLGVLGVDVSGHSFFEVDERLARLHLIVADLHRTSGALQRAVFREPVGFPVLQLALNAAQLFNASQVGFHAFRAGRCLQVALGNRGDVAVSGWAWREVSDDL